MCKQIDDEVVNKIIQELSEEDAEDTTIKIDKNKYGFSKIEDTGWEDDNKYDYRTIIYQLVLYDSKYNIKEKYNAYFEQCSSRTGSYYTDWDYNFDEVERIKRVEKVIPEQIIPEHTVVEWEKYN